MVGSGSALAPCRLTKSRPDCVACARRWRHCEEGRCGHRRPRHRRIRRLSLLRPVLRARSALQEIRGRDSCAALRRRGCSHRRDRREGSGETRKSGAHRRRASDVSETLSLSIRHHVDGSVSRRGDDPRRSNCAVQSGRRRIGHSSGDVREAEPGRVVAKDVVRLESHGVREQIRLDGYPRLAMNLEAALDQYGLLLLQDKKLPSAVGIITGEKVSGSWWSHPRANEIFHKLQALDDALTVKLIAGKVTFVHDRLRPAVVAVGSARERWQMEGLSPAARGLLARIDRDGSARASGASSKQLQERLLVNAREEHTESGKHETVLEAWPKGRLSAEKARHELEKAATAIGAELHDLPWNRFAVG